MENQDRDEANGLALLQMRRLPLITLTAILFLFATLTCRAAEGAADTPAAAGTDQLYRLAPGDRIGVTVFGQPDFSGVFLVDGTGNITLPLVGTVSVRDLTLRESERLITSRLADGYLRLPSVTVRIDELRPIYVVGDVRAPGSYPYRYGASVLSAIALAGGIGAVAADETGAPAAEYLMAEERVRSLGETRRALIVRMARLEAQRDGRTTFEVPDIPATTKEQIASLVQSEKEILQDERRALDSEVELLRELKPKFEAQIQALRGQAEAESSQQDMTETYLEDYKGLMKRGLGNRYTQLLLERDLATNQGNLSKYAADIANLEATIADTDVKILNAQNLYRRRVVDQLADTRAKLRDIEAALPTAREIRELRLRYAGPSATLLSMDKPGRKLTVVRARGGEVHTFAATEATLLEPGDVVEVRMLLDLEGRLDPDTTEPSGIGAETVDNAM